MSRKRNRIFRQPEPAKPEAKRDGINIRIAANRARSAAPKQSPYNYPIEAPKIMAGVLPADVSRAPVEVAMDSLQSSIIQTGYSGGFPGFSYLSQLATRPEYRAFGAALAGEMTRKWIEFTSSEAKGNTTSGKIKQIEEEFIRLGIRKVFNTAVMHDCFFGRAQIFIDLRGHDRHDPLVLSDKTIAKGSLNRITTVEPIWTTPSAYNALDPVAADFYRPTEWYMLGQRVSASRLLTITTRPLPDILKPAFNFAGMSLSQLAEPYVENWLRTRQSVSDLLNNFSITALATSMDQVLQGDDDGADLFARADLFTATRSNRGLMILDKEREELVQVNTPLSGLHELQAQSQEHMCAVSRMPAMILTGISPSGLNASSEGEIRAFYDWISSQQESFWRDPLEIILKVVQLSLFGEIDPSIRINFIPLYQMSEKEQADIRYLDAQTDAIHVQQTGAIGAEEVRERLARDPNSGYMGLDVSEMPEPINPEGELDPESEIDAEDKSTSEAQRKDMEAAAHGKSTIGIPENVGKEFARKDEAAA